MPRQDRKTLKGIFKRGEMPSEASFADLIDSTLNIIDEGLNKNPAAGLQLSQLLDGRLISFYRNTRCEAPNWFMRLDGDDSRLSFSHDAGNETRDVLTLAPIDDTGSAAVELGVGINNNRPAHALDVTGVVASHGRIGRKGAQRVAADGQWHPITDVLSGCNAFEVMAGVGGQDSDGKYALMHAIALSTFNSKNHITYHQAYFKARCNRVELRWRKAGERPFDYRLELRTGCKYGDDVSVAYYLTQLWFDPLMRESIEQERGPEAGA